MYTHDVEGETICQSMVWVVLGWKVDISDLKVNRIAFFVGSWQYSVVVFYDWS